jgi:hypothetical protein
MRDLNDLDPLPKFEADTYCLAGGVLLPESKRQRDEYLREWAKKSGEDWQPYKRDGQIVPHTYINGQGKLKTEGYPPPEPPETDIPIPCVIETFEEELARKAAQLKADMEAVAYWEPQTANRSWPWTNERPTHEWVTDHLQPAEPQTQTASQMEPENLNVGWKDGWIPHKPGDPMPCDPEQVVWIKLRDGTLYEGDEAEKAVYWEWGSGAEQDNDYDIIAWKPAT